MISRCWVIFLMPTFVSGMPLYPLTTRHSGAADRLHHAGHVVSGVISGAPVISHHPGVSATQATGIDQISQVISSDDFLCYNDKTSVVIPDVPCPAESSQKTAVTTQLLNLVLKFQGGETIIPGVSHVTPSHLHGYNLSDIGSADWMNYNKSDLGVRLQTLLQQLQENKTQLLDHLLQYTSSNSLSNITSLTKLLLNVLNSTSLFNICENNTHQNATDNELSCDELLAGIETLNYLNVEARKLLTSEEHPNSSAHININTTATTINGSLGSDANMDAFIDDLIQRLRGTKADSKALAELYTHLLLALNNFKAVVKNLVKKFVTIVLESNFFEISDQLSSILFDLDIALGGDVGIEKSNSLASQTSSTTETSTRSGIVNKTVDFGFTTNNVLFETLTQTFSYLEIKPQEAGQNHMFNYSLLLELSKLNINGTNITSETVQYVEEILKVSVTLIASVTELSQILHKGTVPEIDQDEVLENMTAWHNLRGRTKRDTAGYAINSDRCQRQGTIINQTNFISLCSSCLHTTVLDGTYYPRYLTEKICSSGSSSSPAFRDGCLFQPGLLGGRPGGQCKQQEFHVLLLQQVPGKCMKVVSQGQEIITDQWQSTTHALRIGCECVVDQNSQFAKYTHFP